MNGANIWDALWTDDKLNKWKSIAVLDDYRLCFLWYPVSYVINNTACTVANLVPRSPKAKGKGTLTFQHKTEWDLGTRLHCSNGPRRCFQSQTRKCWSLWLDFLTFYLNISRGAINNRWIVLAQFCWPMRKK